MTNSPESHLSTARERLENFRLKINNTSINRKTTLSDDEKIELQLAAADLIQAMAENLTHPAFRPSFSTTKTTPRD